ncbi:putative calcium-activated chloride channel regulator 1-like [Apostichopus japonicus]|uniref:Putative calcium-activated chloride channel regulator 1-like n=1 Tax=Stichopus japonicus TaxID=307972 RepID=A0A2G8L857_STIJA|nr:putative calcium-activated chloride channel regulator 1-like [Apostichopus japonicus]
MFIDASPYLYEATKRRIFFRRVTILVPMTWNDNALYVSPLNFTFDTADAIVATENPRFSTGTAGLTVPHCKHFEGCGKQAAYIHFSPSFLMDDNREIYHGNTGRLLVHEWGHYRWGLFNEYPDPIADPDFQQSFYHSPTTGRFEATRCSSDYTSYNLVYDEKKSTFRFCNGNQNVGYEDGCISIPSTSQPSISGSIMYGYTSIPEVTQFCDNDTSDPSNYHVTEAPHKHNRLCDLRSNWEVMREHPDFQGSESQPRDIPDSQLVPEIVVARARPAQMVLVLDTSGSMNNYGRIQKQATTAQNFIVTTLVQGTLLGIVHFSDEAFELSNFTLVESDKIIESNNNSAAGATVLLITDGQNTKSPEKLEEMQALYPEKQVKINCVAFTNNADGILRNLSSSTGGRLFLQTDDAKSTGLHDAFIATTIGSGTSKDRPIELLTQSFQMDPAEQRSGGVFIDGTLGNRTTFEFMYFKKRLDSSLQVILTSPSGTVYDESSQGYGVDLTFSVSAFRVAGIAEPGWWSYKVTNRLQEALDILVTIVSYPARHGVEPIITTAEMSDSLTDVSSQHLIAFAEVRQGFSPVVNCRVVATIEDPIGQSMEIELLDNGAGADITTGDGIYSRYVTKYGGEGFYGIRISVDDNNGTALILNQHGAGLPYSRGLAYVDPEELLAGNLPTVDGEPITLPGMPIAPLTGTPAPPFSRQTSAGSSRVEYSGGDFPSNLNQPPSKINDLRVTSTSYSDGHITLEFTAPGSDLDSGTAEKYQILHSTSIRNLHNDGAVELDEHAIVVGNLTEPSPFGKKEKLIVHYPIDEEDDAITINFAIIAFDEVGNESPLSNIATATLRKYIPTASPDVDTSTHMKTTTVPTAIVDLRPDPLPIAALVGGVLGATLFFLLIALFGFMLQKIIVNKKGKPDNFHEEKSPHHQNKGYDKAFMDMKLLKIR